MFIELRLALEQVKVGGQVASDRDDRRAIAIVFLLLSLQLPLNKHTIWSKRAFYFGLRDNRQPSHWMVMAVTLGSALSRL
jgi:hypothetical protein